MYDSRFGRWTSTDPYGQFHSPYLGAGNNPMNLIDPDGGFVGPNFWMNIKAFFVGGVFKTATSHGAKKIGLLSSLGNFLVENLGTISGVANGALNSLDKRPPKVDLSGSADEIYNGVLDWFDWLYLDETMGVREPNDNRGTNFLM